MRRSADLLRDAPALRALAAEHRETIAGCVGHCGHCQLGPH